MTTNFGCRPYAKRACCLNIRLWLKQLGRGPTPIGFYSRSPSQLTRENHRKPSTIFFGTPIVSASTGLVRCLFAVYVANSNFHTAAGDETYSGNGSPIRTTETLRREPPFPSHRSLVYLRRDQYGNGIHCNSRSRRGASALDRVHSKRTNWSRFSRRSVPITRSTKGCDCGIKGTVLISSMSRTRKFANQR